MPFISRSVTPWWRCSSRSDWRSETPSAPGPHQVRVRVIASSINPADVRARSPSLGPRRIERQLPLVLGYDVSGVVDAVGPGVSRGTSGCAPWRPPAGPRRRRCAASSAPRSCSITPRRTSGRPAGI
ncbi:alcohol dehydrogenase catalytic domain-containing protein [Sorangium cellulosum]|uniref:Alcohol dehydrogenase-like N-terminal domain-containing protein n=1 Tax=Sorangium cellulosum So0157-2 TaxID=1254432 RepID=S4Y6S8_SORCE|nr:hypothetical protein SCE1572_31380 [Sorangium cellulosum So0157-2]